MSNERPPYGIPPPGYRLPDATSIGAVRLQVSDLPRSLEYYERVVGLRIQHHDAESARLAPRGEERTLVELRTRSGVTPARRGAFGLYHFAILVPDRAALGRFAAHLTALDVRIGAADHLVSEALYLWDPDGLGIEVYADRARETWQHRARQLVMATDPLDVTNVVAAGGGLPWEGMPPGTVVGHVHLHVGDLGEADAFYHRALGLDRMVWEYPGALFLAAGGYHHHLGTNTWSPGPAAQTDEARLLDWELVVPGESDAAEAAASLRAGGYAAEEMRDGWSARDPWGTTLRLVLEPA
jgi:catechol 2,3-dioxygenase